MIMKDVVEELKTRLSGANKIAFLGIGEEKLSDDGFGPYIISELLDLNSNTHLFINAATDPMSRIEDIENFKPSHLVILDTCTFPDDPGTLVVLERENLEEYIPISSHTIPVHIVIDLIVNKIPELNVFMIGIVPESMDGAPEFRLYKEEELSVEDKSENIDLPFWEIRLTHKVKKVADKLIEIIREFVS